MWEVLMRVQLIASISPSFATGNGARIWPQALPADTIKGMIRLSFAAYRLSLPLSVPANNQKSHDQKFA
jgi:hypothetical protein